MLIITKKCHSWPKVGIPKGGNFDVPMTRRQYKKGPTNLRTNLRRNFWFCTRVLNSNHLNTETQLQMGIPQDSRLPPLVEHEPRQPHSFPPPSGVRSTQPAGTRGSENGSTFGAGAYQAWPQASIVAPVRCGKRKVMMSQTQTRTRTRTKSRNNVTIEGTIERNNMDTMADTCCVGSNWLMIEDTGNMCDVYPFKEGYEAVKDVPVATCATLVEGENGADFILIGHDMLYCGQEMKRSLLNHNQIRDHIRHQQRRVQDNYTRRDEEFGIDTGEIFIPFDLDGSAVFFESRVPTQN